MKRSPKQQQQQAAEACHSGEIDQKGSLRDLSSCDELDLSLSPIAVGLHPVASASAKPQNPYSSRPGSPDLALLGSRSLPSSSSSSLAVEAPTGAALAAVQESIRDVSRQAHSNHPNQRQTLRPQVSKCFQDFNEAIAGDVRALLEEVDQLKAEKRALQ